MLTIYRSNRAEWLAKVLAEHLRLSPPQLCETPKIIVNSWPTSLWLREEISISTGITALIRFPFPREELRNLSNRVLGKEDLKDDPWKPKNLIWHLLEILPELLEMQGSEPLQEWITEHDISLDKLSIRQWQLASIIANTFDDYFLYRPEMILSWLRKGNDEHQSDKDLSINILWQAILFRLLQRKIDNEPFGLNCIKAIDHLKEKGSPIKELPKNLYIFGLSSLAPIQVELIQALSLCIDIRIYLLTPCPELWQRCRNKRKELVEPLTESSTADLIIEGPRLEATLGRMGCEFQQLLEGSGESQLGEWKEGDLFAAPVNIALRANKEPTLLEHLQQQLLSREKEEKLHREIDDNSLLFIACPGKWRQVQLVRDQLIQLFATYPYLQPKDILIMTPQIKELAPIISSVFNDITATGIEIPWRITDRNQQEIAVMTQWILEFLGIANSRLTSSTLDRIIRNKVIHKKHKLDDNDVNQITSCLQRSGFRWGLDGFERGGEEKHSLQWCLDRWMLGLALPCRDGIAPMGTAPFAEGIEISNLKKWWTILNLINKHLQEFRNSHSCKRWVDILRKLADDFFDNTGQFAEEKMEFLYALEDLRSRGEIYKLQIEVDVIIEILRSSLLETTRSFGHRSGKVTFSALEPMRAIPYQVIILMGLDADIFPKCSTKQTFSLLERKKYLGDPNANEQDRYAILEALMSSRQNLIITWNSRNEITGEEKPPANPIEQWLNQLKNELSEKEFSTILIEPSANPLDHTNFILNKNVNPLSCDQRNLTARQALDKSEGIAPIALAIPLKYKKTISKGSSLIDDTQLRNWITAPQISWLEQIKIKPREWIQTINDLEEFKLDELERYKIIKNSLNNLIDQIDSEGKQLDLDTNNISWEDKLMGQGILPSKSAGYLENEVLMSRWKNLLLTITELGPIHKYSIEFEDNNQDILIAGEYSIVIEIGKIKYRTAMEAWLKHLQICSRSELNKSTIIISRNPSRVKPNNFIVSLKLRPISKGLAQEKLNDLREIASQGLISCWPIPPESGWEYLKAIYKNPLKAKELFRKKWEGSSISPGEKNKPEMKICFGTNCDASMLFSNTAFKSAVDDLYKPILEEISYL